MSVFTHAACDFAALYVVHSVCVKYVHKHIQNTVKTWSCATRLVDRVPLLVIIFTAVVRRDVVTLGIEKTLHQNCYSVA